MMDQVVQAYLAEIGRRGGLKSRRHLTAAAARRMVQVREARRAFRRFYAQCFWSFDPDYQVKLADIPWIVAQLMGNGGSKAWQTGARLCR